MGNTRSTAATPNTELSIPPSEEACQAMTTKSLLDKEYWTKSVLRKDTGVTVVQVSPMFSRTKLHEPAQDIYPILWSRKRRMSLCGRRHHIHTHRLQRNSLHSKFNTIASIHTCTVFICVALTNKFIRVPRLEGRNSKRVINRTRMRSYCIYRQALETEVHP
ncbi:hypothetical protein BC629DRAFT_1532288 [Irpex lacteus]|nr:hypothetical protein BC629DRAFT_1532288 [Irpex lacteus]